MTRALVLALSLAACGGPAADAPAEAPRADTGGEAGTADGASPAARLASPRQDRPRREGSPRDGIGADGADDGPPPVADIEVTVRPELGRDDLLEEAHRLRQVTEGCDGNAELAGRVAALEASSDERELWHRYALVIAVARRVERACR